MSMQARWLLALLVTLAAVMGLPVHAGAADTSLAAIFAPNSVDVVKARFAPPFPKTMSRVAGHKRIRRGIRPRTFAFTSPLGRPKVVQREHGAVWSGRGLTRLR